MDCRPREEVLVCPLLKISRCLLNIQLLFCAYDLFRISSREQCYRQSSVAIRGSRGIVINWELRMETLFHVP